MNNNFNFGSYFAYNYGLGNKPTISPKTFKINKKHIIGFVIALILLCIGKVATIIIGLLVAAYVGGVMIARPIMQENARIKKETEAAAEWQRNYDYRNTHWDADFDKFEISTIEGMNIKERGMSVLGIDESQLKQTAPFCAVTNITGNNAKFGRDGKLRSDNKEHTWFYFSEDEIYIYTIKFKLSNVAHASENTQEFFYSDITSINMGRRPAANGGAEIDEIQLVVPGDKISYSFNTNSDEVKKSVNALKNLIRDKKKAPQFQGMPYANVPYQAAPNNQQNILDF